MSDGRIQSDGFGLEQTEAIRGVVDVGKLRSTPASSIRWREGKSSQNDTFVLRAVHSSLALVRRQRAADALKTL